MLKHFKHDQVKLSFNIYQFNQILHKTHIEVQHEFLFNKKLDTTKYEAYLKQLSKYFFKLQKYNKEHPSLNEEFGKVLKNINKNLLSYKNTLLSLLHLKDKNNSKQKLVQLKNIMQQFAINTSYIIEISNANIYEDIITLEHNNNINIQSVILALIMAIVIISYILYKFKIFQVQLSRAQKTKQNLTQVQEQLLQYNNDLESQISIKTQELHLKSYNHFISGLPNRNRLLQDIQTFEFKHLVLFNIDNFQSFNDVYGEEIGNVAIKLTSGFLTEQIEEPELYLYHIGGDEFAIVCRDSHIISEYSFMEKVENILKNYKSTTFRFEDKKFTFMMSAGISFNEEKKKMLAYADMALKDAKKRNIQLAIFNNDKELEKGHKEDIACHKKLVTAIQNNTVISFFQPITPIQDKTRVTKYESLVRLIYKEEIISPIRFLRVAKAHRIYYKITRAVIQNTFEVISKYKIPCSINLSLTDIDNTKTMEHFFHAIESFEYNELLTIELLETEDFKNYDNVYNFCVNVRTYGIKVALDDFGAGYSNFSHILNLPVDYIKIDASLISNIDRDHNAQIMVETIVSLAKRLNVETIAEFVSSKDILNTITKIGVDYAQGYYIGKPEPIKKHLNL